MRKFTPIGGCNIEQAIKIAKNLAERRNDRVKFNFNGVKIIVAKDSSPELILRDFRRAIHGYLGDNPVVSHYPYVTLSQADLDSDAAIQAEKDRKRVIAEAEYAKKQARQTALLQGGLSVAGPLALRDSELWEKYRKKNTDNYGARIVKYAEDWGRLMQTRIANGESISECAKELSDLADDDGITGFMYGAAVQMLASCWEHGEDLRRWHNKDMQIGTEGDEANESGHVLNPALLSIRRT